MSFGLEFSQAIWHLVSVQRTRLNVIKDRFPISIYYGLVTSVGLMLSAFTRSRQGRQASPAGYRIVDIHFHCSAVPGYALGSLLLFSQSAGLVSKGDESFNYDLLTPTEQWLDIIHHPFSLICYIIGSFALVTMLLKNHLLDNLAADYIRTAIAKGVI